MANNRPMSAPATPGKEPERFAKALFAYESKYGDELTFKEGEILTVLSTSSIEDGWYRARTKDGRVGIIPGNYVIFVESNQISPDFGRTSSPLPGSPATGGVPLLDSGDGGSAAYGRQRKRVASSFVSKLCCGFCDR
ncbi:MAG: SH3 domain-containing protein [archaeon]|nr:SH3 domain-containing protein [archaeon]